MKNSSVGLYKKVYDFLLRHEGLILLLSFHLLLRIPHLFEPYWYGDEAIYLTVGNGLRHGLKLYAEIVDHKTPLIYFLAIVPSQFWFRMLLTTWMSLAIIAFFFLTKRLKFTQVQTYITSLLFIIFTSLPWLEGNIPNGELFVMGFILIGAWFFTRSRFFYLFMDGKLVAIKNVLTKRQIVLFTLAGTFFALGILTKVPAIFDVLPFFLVGFFSLIDHFSVRRSRRVLFSSFGMWEILGMAVTVPLILSFVYFALRGSLSSYIDIGVLYNFRYAGNWPLPVLPFGLSVLLTLKGKLFILGAVILLVSLLRKKLSSRSQFIVTWAVCSLFGALLSSRPYPHYLLQAVPGFALLIGLFFAKSKYRIEYVVNTVPIMLLVLAVITIQFGFYKTGIYYINFFKYLTGQTTKQEYYQSFDSLMTDNYKAASILQQDSQPRMFIWGTNPTLYALSKKIPTGRFTVAFHLPDFPGAFDETYRDLVIAQPQFIVVMKNEQIKFPRFFTYLHMNYLPYEELDHMTIYKRIELSHQ